MKVIVIISQHTRYRKIDKNITKTVRRCANELVNSRTMDHLIEKKYQVGVQWWNMKLRSVIEKNTSNQLQ